MAPAAIDASMESPDLSKDSTAWSVQSLVERGVTEVPARYVRNTSSFGDCPTINDFSVEIPVIDYAKMQGENGADEVSKYIKAAEEWGFLQLVNHGLTEGLIDETLDVARGFFQLPVSEKQKYFSPDPDVPLEGYARINTVDGVIDWGDTIIMNADVPVLQKDKTDFSDWNHLPEKFRGTLVTYGRQTHSLGLKLMKLLSDAAGMTDVEETGGPQGLQLGLNFYPPCPQPDLVFGISAHTDPQTFSVLIQDQPGLQVLNNESWVPVRRLDAALIVNVGDQLEIMSNGRYKSVMHRVVVNPNTERFFVGSFVRPLSESVVGPDPRLINEEHPPLYKPLKYDDYINSGVVNGFTDKQI